jgi:hypothetical protein
MSISASPPHPASLLLRLCAACSLLVLLAFNAHATVASYDAIINQDAAAGLTPLARLTSAVTLTGANRAAFDFGNSSGDVTMEFILEGNVTPSISAYLAVGVNSTSNLRFEAFNDTGQLGFTQLGVADYLFLPAVPSPNIPVHIAYVWNAATLTMKLYLNGSLAGSRSGVNAGFAMPRGAGFLGANPSNTENMTGTIYRVTVYDDIIPDDAIQRHSDAFNDIVRPPVLVSFSANPPIIFTPQSSTLSWNVQNATALFLNGSDVTGTSGTTVNPAVTTTYLLVATNSGGSVTGRVTVLVNPAPIIDTFTSSKGYAAAGEIIQLSWSVRYGEQFSISPGVGDVTANTVDGVGSVSVPISAATTFTLTASSSFGTSTASLELILVQPASHLVISEIVADNESGLMDEDGAFPDWLEIFNPTASAINLLGYYLTDDKSEPLGWAFPNITLGPGEHLVVFASGKNRVVAGAPLHTDFDLDKDGEYLGLIGPGAVIVHEFDPYPSQREDVSYGLLGGDVSLQVFMGIPTPGAPNNATRPPPDRVQFSHASGTFSQPFMLSLTCATPGAEIRYTLDGSSPDGTNSIVYQGPISIAATRRIRAAAFQGGLVSEITRASFIKLAADLLNYTSSLPIMVIDNFAAGIIPQKGWTGNGSGVKQVPRQSAVWLTFDRENGGAALTNSPQMFANVGIRGRGAFSSQWRQKPYSVEGLGEYGEEVDLSPLGMPPHADWVLYFPDPDSNKDPALLFNTFPYELSARSGRYSVRFRWVEAFVNEDGGDLRLADRRGIYAIIEKVSRGADRLDFDRLSSDGSTGGWLLNLNRMDPEPENGWPAENGATQPWFFHTAGQNRIPESPPNGFVVGDDEPQQANGFLNFDNPSGYTINTNQRVAIENWFKQFEDVLWNSALWRNPTNGYRKYIDPVDFADYFILNVLTRNGDGLLISMFPWKGDDGKLRMGPAWDYNWSAYFISGTNATGSLMHRSDRLWYRRLFTDPDFMQLYIDRWWDLRRGPMSNAGMDDIIDGQAADITVEKALLNGITAADWTNRLALMKTWLKERANWIDGNYIRPPTFNHEGGDVPDGFQVTILGTNGTIYFTTDGSDPRAPGGAVASSAQAFQMPFPVKVQTIVQARIRNGTSWSGLGTVVFYPPQDLTKLVLTEIMYHPPSFGAFSADDVEFLELKNVGTQTLHLGTLFFAEGITFSFTNNTRLGPGEFFILARNATGFIAKYPGIAANGVYSARLDNGGERLRLATLAGGTIFSVDYNDRPPWPITADGHGFSVVPRNVSLAANSDDGARWRASAFAGGSPGADDPEVNAPPVLVNEVYTHSVFPELDWIELFNPNAFEVNIGGWFLSDDPVAPRKYRILDGTTIIAGSYRIFSETNFNADPLSAYSFSLDSGGDAVYLTAGDATTNLTGFSHGFSLGASAAGASFGRYVNSTGEEQFPAQVSPTPLAANAGPKIGPIVIQEIMYHPESGGDEFIEVRNISAAEVALFDPDRPLNTWWIDGLSFALPTNIVLPANGILLVAASDPAAFRAKYDLPLAVQIVGPFAGVLQDSGERLQLQRPGQPDTNGTLPFITVDEVRYNDKLPWPPAADGSGASLQRRIPDAYGNDPINWEAAIPTPGADFVPGQGPIITSHPQDRNALSSDTVQFSVTAAGAPPLSYQWLFNGDLLAGETEPVLVIASVQPAHAGNYSAIVFNDAGSAVSASARLIVNRRPTITAQPTNLLVRPGSNAVLSVSAIGNGVLRYQWRRNDQDLPLATNASLTITNAQTNHVGTYLVVVTDTIASTISAPAILGLAIDPIIIQQPLSQTVVQGGTVTLSIGITNTANLPVTYRWRRGTGFIVTNILNAHVDFLTVTNVQPIAQLTNFLVVVYNPARPASPLLSTVASLTILADFDTDGLPDAWEAASGFPTNSAANATDDPDGDTLANWQEYIAGTDPTNAMSYLKVEHLLTTPESRQVQFTAISNRTYSVVYKNALENSDWSELASFAARVTNRTETAIDLSPLPPQRLYRVMTPARR